MKCFLLLSLFALVVNSATPYSQPNPPTKNHGGGPFTPTCPDRNTCGRPSPLANLICYAYHKANGFNYAFIGFDANIVAFVGINLNCQPGVTSVLDVQVIYGFMFRLTYPVWRDKTIEHRSKLWYLNLAVPGCPSIDEIVYRDYTLKDGQFNKALYPTPVETIVAYTVYQQMIERDNYKIQCNVFGSEKVDDNCNCCPPAPYKTPPITRISLGSVKSALLYNANPKTINGSGFEYIHAYGINGIECIASHKPEPGLVPKVYPEICTSYDYDSYPYCKNFQNSATLDDIARSYGIDGNLEYLDVYKACKLATLWTQGYNCKSGNNDGYPSCPRNEAGSGSFTYINMAIIPMVSSFIDFDTPSFPESFIYLFIMKGYCPTSVRDAMMQYFTYAC